MLDVISRKTESNKQQVSVFSPSFDYGRTGLDAINSPFPTFEPPTIRAGVVGLPESLSGLSGRGGAWRVQ